MINAICGTKKLVQNLTRRYKVTKFPLFFSFSQESLLPVMDYWTLRWEIGKRWKTRLTDVQCIARSLGFGIDWYIIASSSGGLHAVQFKEYGCHKHICMAAIMT